MDAIAAGWQHGRRTPNLQFGKWEASFTEPLAAVRERHGITPIAATT